MERRCTRTIKEDEESLKAGNNEDGAKIEGRL